MREAQRLAALAVRRVLDGSTLPRRSRRSRRRSATRRAPPRARPGARVRHAAPLGMPRRAGAPGSRRSRSPIRRCMPRRRCALPARPHARAALRRRRSCGERGGGTRAPRREGARQRAAAALSCASAKRCTRRSRRSPSRAGRIRAWWIDRVAARISRRLAATFSPRATRVLRSPCASTARRRRAKRCSTSSPRRVLKRRPPGGAGILVEPAEARARAAGVRGRRVFGPGPRGAARRAALSLARASACSTRAPRPAARRRTSPSSPTSSSSRSTATKRDSPACRKPRTARARERERARRRRRRRRSRRMVGREPFDRILADVPCTASGIVRRHPDIKWLRRETDIANFARQQARLLDALWSLPRARRTAALCDVLGVRRRRTRRRSRRSSRAHADALRETLTFPPEVACRRRNSCLRSRGAGHNQDGFFYALLRKP